MTIDFPFLKRELHRNRMPLRTFFRLARLSQSERTCIVNGVCVLSYATARVCSVLDCRQDALARTDAGEVALAVNFRA